MTHTTNFKRTVCCLLAVLMLCTCVIRPLEVKAVALEVGIGLGAAVILILFTAGIVLHPKTAEQVTAIGADFVDFVKTKEEEELDKIDWWIEFREALLRSRAFGSNQLVPTPEGPYDRTPLGLSPELLAVLSAYIVKITMDGVMIESDLLPVNWLYYNGVAFPEVPQHDFPDLYPYMVIAENETYGYIEVIYSSGPFYYEPTTTFMKAFEGSKFATAKYDAESYTWGRHGSSAPYTPTNPLQFNKLRPIWANYDIYDFNDPQWLLMASSEPTSEYVTTIESIRIAEIPTQDDGSPDPEKIEENLPAVIYPQKLLYDTQKETLTEAVQEVVSRLESGELTYEQYMEQIQGELGEVPGEGTETETQPGTSPDPTPDGSEDVEVKSGLRKLVDFFTGTTFVESPLQAMNFDKLFDLFPFNIPAGIYQTISFWNADATPPTLTLPSLAFDGNKVTGDEFSFNLADMPGMNEIAALIRAGVLILYAVGLLMITRKVTKW